MKKYVRYSIAILLGGLLLGLAGCGSSDGSCSSGETMTTNGCGTGSCTVSGTNQTGAIVGSTCYALSGSTTSSYTCQANYSLQSVPSQYSYQYSMYGGQACCPSGLNLSQFPQGISYCSAPMGGTTGYGYGVYTGTTGQVGGACPIPGYPEGYIYEGGETCIYP